VNLEPIEAAALAGADRGEVPPRCVRVAEPLTLTAALGNEPLAVGVGGKVGPVDGDVLAELGRLLAKRDET
jgi:hypothetical protein